MEKLHHALALRSIALRGRVRLIRSSNIFFPVLRRRGPDDSPIEFEGADGLSGVAH